MLLSNKEKRGQHHELKLFVIRKWDRCCATKNIPDPPEQYHLDAKFFIFGREDRFFMTKLFDIIAEFIVF